VLAAAAVVPQANRRLEPRPSTHGEVSPGGGPSGELLGLVRSLRAFVEQHEAAGGWGLPVVSPARAAATVPLGPPSATEQAARSTERRPDVVPQPTEALSAPARASVSVTGGAAVEAERAVRRLPVAGEARLQEIATEARACTRCALHEGRSQSVFARGTGASGLVFVGEGPGEEEDRQGLPFVGPAGQLLDRMIGAMQLGRDDVYVCNIVKCRPPKNRKPDPDEMARCMPFLAEQLEILAPRVIVALGATAVQGLLGTTEGITRLRGNWKVYRGKVPVMPTFHPAYLLRTPQAKRDVWKDLQEVLRHLQTGSPIA
jgi:uracil-DNA glycosylase